MFIHEAVAKAQKNNEVIYRASAKRKEQDIYALIKPTNSYDACQIIVCRHGKPEEAPGHGIRRPMTWQQMIGNVYGMNFDIKSATLKKASFF